MLYGFYVSGQAAEAQAFRQTVLANNLANAGTTAFKRDIPLFRAYFNRDRQEGHGPTPENVLQQTGGVDVEGTATDYSTGPITNTGRRLDVAMAGPGFLKVSNGKQEFLTRNGRLSLTSRNELVMADTGHAVLDNTNQPIVLPEGTTDLEIASDGSLAAIQPSGNRTTLGALSLVEPTAYESLVKEGNSLYRALGSTKPPGPQLQVKQGHLEESGISPVSGMVELIETSRAFETSMNMLRLQDESLGQLLQSIPRR